MWNSLKYIKEKYFELIAFSHELFKINENNLLEHPVIVQISEWIHNECEFSKEERVVL